MNAEEILQKIIGSYVMQIASLSAERDRLLEVEKHLREELSQAQAALGKRKKKAPQSE